MDSNNPKKLKRVLSDSDDDVDSTMRVASSFAKFVVVNSATEHPLKLNPFVVEKTIKGIAGTVASVKRLRTGGILIECINKQQSLNLLSTTVYK